MPQTYNVDRATKLQAQQILSRYHYLKTKGFRCSHAYGLFDGENIVGVCVFHGVSAPETCVGAFGLPRTSQHGIFELGRLAVHPSLNGGNTTSWFVSRAIKMLRNETDVRAIISYADSGAGHLGSIYRACNALYCGTTSPKSDFYVAGKIQERGKTKGVSGVWKPRSAKHRYVWIFDGSLVLKWKVLHYNKSGIAKNIVGCITDGMECETNKIRRSRVEYDSCKTGNITSGNIGNNGAK